MSMSEVAYNNLKQSYTDVFEQLTQLEADFDKVEADLFTEAGEVRVFKKKNPYTKLIERLHGHPRQLPVVGFNSGKYDLNVMIKFLLPHFLLHGNRKGKLVDETSSWFIIKKQNNLMCLSTNTLKFLDITNYLAPGFSYDKYLKAYGCTVTKGNFPYEYMNCLQKLNERTLPPKEAFFSKLKNENISEDDYAHCQRV